MSTLMLPKTMRAAMFLAPGQLEMQDVQTPEPGPGELLVKVGVALTCGTDLKCYRRGHPVLLKSIPSLFGHEFSGVVAATGAGVSAFNVGDRVVAANSAPCMTCYFCQHNQHNLCEKLELLNGAYAEFINIPAPIVARNTYVVPEQIPDELAAFAEPLAVCLRCVTLSNIQPGDCVAVLGSGSIGLLLAKLAKQQGAHVTIFGRNPLKQSLAQSFAQADEVFDRDFMRDLMIDLSALRQASPQGFGPHGFDKVLEATGLPAVWEQAISLVRKGGVVALFGGCPGGTHIQVDTRRLHYDEITLLGLFHHTPAFFKQALDLLITGAIDPRPLLTQRLPLSDCVEALKAMEAGQAVKVALFPG